MRAGRIKLAEFSGKLLREAYEASLLFYELGFCAIGNDAKPAVGDFCFDQIPAYADRIRIGYGAARPDISQKQPDLSLSYVGSSADEIIDQALIHSPRPVF